MRSRPWSVLTRRLVVIAGVVAVLALVAVAGALVLRSVSTPDSRLAQAAEVSPGGSQRLSFTDWAGVRDELDADLDAASPGTDVRAFLDGGFRSGLTSTSALVASAEPLADRFGLSPATVEWEGFSQSAEGAVVSLRLPDSSDVDQVGDRLSGLGFTAPDGDDGVWDGGADLLAGIDPALSPVFGYVVLLADEGLVLTSDDPDDLATARAAALGEEPSMLTDVTDVVGSAADALSAAVYTGTYACGELAMTNADPRDQATGERLVEQAGDVDPLTSFAMVQLPGGDVRTVLGFEDDDASRANADPRARLASGPAPGQGGSFRQRFELTSASSEGRALVLDMEPRRGQLLLSDLSTGPLLFAAC